MHELDDERPILLGRARAAAAIVDEADSDAGGNRGRHTHDCPASTDRAATRSADGNRTPVGDGCLAPTEPPAADEDRAVAPPPPPQPAPTSTPPHIERTRPADSSTPPVAMLMLPEPLTAVMAGLVAAMPAAEAPAASRPAAAEPATPTAPDGHPLAGLRRLRMDVELAASVHRPWREVLRNLAIGYVVVIGSILGLLAAFLALTGTAGSARP